jgi:tetratricopeptide (TPR) repeat protein
MSDETATPTAAELNQRARRLLAQRCPQAAELQAFIVDHFPDQLGRVPDKGTPTEQTMALLAAVGGLAVLRALGEGGGGPAEPSQDLAEALRAGRPTGVFVGRQRELDWLQARLCGASAKLRPVAVCALQGMPGVGKSYLCDQFFERNRAAFPGGYVVLSLSPKVPATTASLLVELVARLRVDVPADAQAQAVAARLREPRTLLHVENVDDEALAAAVVGLVQQLTGCAVLVSARQQDVGVSSSLRWERLPLPPLPDVEALDQLASEFRPPTTPKENELYRQVVTALGALPLAIHLAAGRLARGLRIESLLKDIKGWVLDRKAVDPGEHSRQLLAASILASLRALEQAVDGDKDPALSIAQVAPALSGFAAGPASGVGDSLAYALLGLGDAASEALLLRALGYSLVERVAEERGTRWRMHPLIATTVAFTCAPPAAAGLAGMAAWFLDRLPERLGAETEQQAQHWQAIQAEEPALLHWLASCPADRAAEVARIGHIYACICGPYAAWRTLCQRSLAQAEAPADRSALLRLLCETQRRSGQLDEALATAQDRSALAKSSGDEATHVSALSQIADIYQARGQLDEALRIRREEELPVFEKLGLVRDAMICRWWLARYHLQRGQTGDRRAARELLSRALADAKALGLPEAAALAQELKGLD